MHFRPFSSGEKVFWGRVPSLLQFQYFGQLSKNTLKIVPSNFYVSVSILSFFLSKPKTTLMWLNVKPFVSLLLWDPIYLTFWLLFCSSRNEFNQIQWLRTEKDPTILKENGILSCDKISTIFTHIYPGTADSSEGLITRVIICYTKS